jgi:hypothetical protein
MISSVEINLGEHFGPIQLIKYVFNLWEWVHDEVLPRQCPCLRAFDSWSVLGIR